MKHTNYAREKDRATAQPTRLTAAAEPIQNRDKVVPATPALDLVRVCIEFTPEHGSPVL